MPTLLVVEDDATIAEMFALMLAVEGYEVRPASTTAEALAILSRYNVDLIMADLAPGPYADASWESVRQLQRAAPTIPMIVCTGHNEAAKVPPEQEGVDAILLKPFDLDHLLALIAQFC
jgi:CheY-like chemotaxis protein